MDKHDQIRGVTFEWGDIKKNWKIHLFLGLLFVVAGTIGMVLTPLATLSTIYLFAFFMGVCGMAQWVASRIKWTQNWEI